MPVPIASSKSILPNSANLTAMLREVPLPFDFVLPGFKLGTVGGLISPGGVGKSYWALAVAVSISASPGVDLTGLSPSTGRVLMLSAEDPEDVLAQRVYAMRDYLPRGVNLDNLDYRSCVSLNLDLMDLHWYSEILQAARGCRLVVLDTLNRMHQLDENSSPAMKSLMAQMERLAKESGAAVLYLHHTSKAAAVSGQGSMQQAARGSSVLIDNARWASFLAVMSEGEAKIFGVPYAETGNYVRWNISKQNYGAPRADQWYHRGPSGILAAVQLEKQVQSKGMGTAMGSTSVAKSRSGAAPTEKSMTCCIPGSTPTMASAETGIARAGTTDKEGTPGRLATPLPEPKHRAKQRILAPVVPFMEPVEDSCNTERLGLDTGLLPGRRPTATNAFGGNW